MKFWDSSAIVPLLVEEPTRNRLIDLLEEDSTMLVWWATSVECISAVARREREGNLSVTDATTASERLRALALGWNEVEASNAVREMAKRLLRVHPLRAADALQLAAATVVAESDPASLHFVSLDERLSVAAQREGFCVIGI